jgi:hypothetical protein
LAARDRTEVWVYRFLAVVVVVSIVNQVIIDSTKYLHNV